MPQKFVRVFSLPEDLENRLQQLLKARFGLELSSAKELAAAVQKMSDYYIENPDAATPWSERWAQIAQLIYFFPLNFLRLRAVVHEGLRFGFFDGLQTTVDFGAGLGPVAWALKESGYQGSIEGIEKSADALQLGKALASPFLPVSQANGRPSKLLSFSYSLTELASLPKWALDFGSLMIIEPSTRQDGRRLLGIRQDLLDQGYSMWAPCPHQQACPLLTKSPSDWCHDRIHFDRPTWWLEMEKHLPFENPTLTFSYLLASKRPSPVPEKTVRLVGDFMKEKGKSRQMICRNSEREFFAWLARQGEVTEWPRGALLKEPTQVKFAGNELRPQEELESLL